MATCLCRCCDIMCSWDWCICVAKKVFQVVAHILGDLQFEVLCDLCVHGVGDFPKVVR